MTQACNFPLIRTTTTQRSFNSTCNASNFTIRNHIDAAAMQHTYKKAHKRGCLKAPISLVFWAQWLKLLCSLPLIISHTMADRLGREEIEIISSNLLHISFPQNVFFGLIFSIKLLPLLIHPPVQIKLVGCNCGFPIKKTLSIVVINKGFVKAPNKKPMNSCY